MSVAHVFDADDAFADGAAARGLTLALAQLAAWSSVTHLTQRPRLEEPAKRAPRRTVQICSARSDGASFETRRLRPGDEAGGQKHDDLESRARPLAHKFRGKSLKRPKTDSGLAQASKAPPEAGVRVAPAVTPKARIGAGIRQILRRHREPRSGATIQGKVGRPTFLSIAASPFGLLALTDQDTRLGSNAGPANSVVSP